jgi:IS30 family transposase
VLPDMINVSARPAVAADRAVPGHWEGDLIIGKANASAIGTLVERTTGYTMLLHLPNGYKPEQFAPVVAAKIKTLPKLLRGSLTWDQGVEMRYWKQVTVAADIAIFLCDPHSPLGSEERTRTPMGCFASTSPKALTCQCTTPPTLTWWPRNSTIDPAND